MALHRRKASLFRCKTVVRRASCDLQRAAGIRVARAQAPLRWLSLGRWQNTRACRARGRAALVVIAFCTMEGHCTGGRPLSFGARPWCDVRAVTSNAQPAFAWHARKRHCAGCLSGGGETRELAARARRAALVVICLRTMEGHCTGGRPLSFGARPWCDVRAVASNAQPAFAWHARERHCAGCLSGGGRTRKLAARARRAALVVIGLRTMKGTAPAEDLSLSVQDRGATCELWPPTRSRHSRGTRKRHCAGCLSGGGETRELAARARRAALAVIGPTLSKGTAPAGGLSLSVQDRGATCEL